MAYFDDDYLAGLYTGPRMILFAKTNGRPIRIRDYEEGRYLATGRWIKRPQDAENPDRLMIRDEYAKCMEKAGRRVFYFGHIDIIKSFKAVSKKFHDHWAEIMKQWCGLTPDEYNEFMREFT